jgi:putative transposase
MSCNQAKSGTPLAGTDDELVEVRPVLDRIPNFSDLLRQGMDEDFADLRDSQDTGRPVGAEAFVIGLKQISGRKIARRAPGRQPKGTAGRRTA